MVQRRVAIVAVVVVVAAVLALLVRPPIEEPAFSHELIAMQRSMDDVFGGQARRFSISDLPEEIRNRFEEQRDIDRENMERLRPLLERFGWPTDKLVGREAVSAAMNVVQRAPDVAFQEFAVGLMRKRGADDNIPYARLVDMIAVAKGEPQTYGTIWMCADGSVRPTTPVRDPERLDERRHEVGLDRYEQFAGEFCGEGFEQGDGTVAPVVVTPVRPD